MCLFIKTLINDNSKKELRRIFRNLYYYFLTKKLLPGNIGNPADLDYPANNFGSYI